MASAKSTLCDCYIMFHWRCGAGLGSNRHARVWLDFVLPLTPLSGSNGANLSWPDAFGVPDEDPTDPAINAWIVGIVNSAPYIASALM